MKYHRLQHDCSQKPLKSQKKRVLQKTKGFISQSDVKPSGGCRYACFEKQITVIVPLFLLLSGC